MTDICFGDDQYVSKVSDFVNSCSGPYRICVFPDIFEKYFKAVCGESGIFESVWQMDPLFSKTKEPYETEKDTSYLLVSGL